LRVPVECRPLAKDFASRKAAWDEVRVDKQPTPRIRNCRQSFEKNRPQRRFGFAKEFLSLGGAITLHET
jgi:hypothetical protein